MVLFKDLTVYHRKGNEVWDKRNDELCEGKLLPLRLFLWVDMVVIHTIWCLLSSSVKTIAKM